jgi:hypothetical protein
MHSIVLLYGQTVFALSRQHSNLTITLTLSPNLDPNPKPNPNPNPNHNSKFSSNFNSKRNPNLTFWHMITDIILFFQSLVRSTNYDDIERRCEELLSTMYASRECGIPNASRIREILAALQQSGHVSLVKRFNRKPSKRKRSNVIDHRYVEGPHSDTDDDDDDDDDDEDDADSEKNDTMAMNESSWDDAIDDNHVQGSHLNTGKRTKISNTAEKRTGKDIIQFEIGQSFRYKEIGAKTPTGVAEGAKKAMWSEEEILKLLSFNGATFKFARNFIDDHKTLFNRRKTQDVMNKLKKIARQRGNSMTPTKTPIALKKNASNKRFVIVHASDLESIGTNLCTDVYSNIDLPFGTATPVAGGTGESTKKQKGNKDLVITPYVT